MSKKKITTIITALFLLTFLLLNYLEGSNFIKNQGQNDVLGEDKPITSNPLLLGKQSAKVTKVHDGDTIEVEIKGQKFDVRYIGIDTPETVDPRRPVGCFGREASDENKELVSGKIVYLEKDFTEFDKYNRLLRYVYIELEDGSVLFVNDYLVREGFANSYTYPPDVKYDQRFREAEADARINGRGLWGRCNLK